MVTMKRVKIIGGVSLLAIIFAGSIVFGVWFGTGPHTFPPFADNSPFTIHGSGYVIDALDVQGQTYLQQEDGTITIIVPGE